MSAVVLAEVLRGDRVESRHAGAFAVTDAVGGVVLQAGDIEAPVFPRSAVKAFQALPLIETGAADRFGLTEAELALACASHSGEPVHAAIAAGVLAKAGRDADCLECGTQWPMGEQAARDLAGAGRQPSALHNNCSGKHAGFVCVACAMGLATTTGYVRPEHPVMQEVTAALSDMTSTKLGEANRATDGCSIPTYAVPLRSLARAFARLGTGIGIEPVRAAALRRLRAAVAANPHLVAGTGRFDTELMQAFGAQVFVKSGAEGVHCGALPDLGLGFAVKCEDGAGRAAQVVAAALVARFLRAPSGTDLSVAVAERLARPALVNWNGLTVGSLRPAGPLAAA